MNVQTPHVGRGMQYKGPILIAVYCAMAAGRDACSELLLKEVEPIHPVLLLWCYSLAGIVLGAVLQLASRGRVHDQPSGSGFAARRRVVTRLIQLNIVTALAYITAIAAIWSQLGAAFNAVIDYGMSPIFTLIVAFALFGEKLTVRILLSVVTCAMGIVLITANRDLGSISEVGSFSFGVICAMISAVGTAFNINISKQLVAWGIPKSRILMYRLLLVFVGSSIALVFIQGAFTLRGVMLVSPLALFGFALPVYLLLTAFEHVRMRVVSLLLFLMPVFTYAFSAVLGFATVDLIPILGALSIIVGVLYSKRDILGESPD